MSIEAFWGFSDRQWTRSGLTLAEGVTLARRLLTSSLVPQAVLCLASHEQEFVELAAGRCPVTVLTLPELQKWAGFAFHRGVLAVALRPQPLLLETYLESAGPRSRLAVAPQLTDPENLGALFRCALALGWDAVAIGPSSCDPLSRRTAKVSMGAVYSHPPVILPDDPARLKVLFERGGWHNLALALEPGAQDLAAWSHSESGQRAQTGRLSVWVGNEFEGLPQAYRAVCQTAVVIPMTEGHDSLNAAVAAGIALYALR